MLRNWLRWLLGSIPGIFLDSLRRLFFRDLINESFEGATTALPAGWLVEGIVQRISGSWTWQNSLSYAGYGDRSKAAECYFSEAVPFNEFLFTPLMTFSPGETLNLSCYLKKEPYNKTNANLRIHLCGAQRSDSSITVLTEAVFTDNNFQVVTLHHTFPVGSAITNVCVAFQAQGQIHSGYVSFCIDRVVIRK